MNKKFEGTTGKVSCAMNKLHLGQACIAWMRHLSNDVVQPLSPSIRSLALWQRQLQRIASGNIHDLPHAKCADEATIIKAAQTFEQVEVIHHLRPFGNDTP